MIGLFDGRVPMIVETVGGKSGRIQFGHACSLLIFVVALAQNAHCFLVVMAAGDDQDR